MGIECIIYTSYHASHSLLTIWIRPHRAEPNAVIARFLVPINVYKQWTIKLYTWHKRWVKLIICAQLNGSMFKGIVLV